jgi:hypothetical protein
MRLGLQPRSLRIDVWAVSQTCTAWLRQPQFVYRAAVFSGGAVSGAAFANIMVQISVREWQIAGVVAGAALAGAATYWLLHRKHPTADELELERREMLLSFGRIVDGMLLDGFQITAEDGTTRDMLLYQYEISGVNYECSQDITRLGDVLDPAAIKIGMPCSIRYQPGSPENSILVSERWSGLRDGVPVMWLNPPPGAAKRHAGEASLR